jgi:hypothetical protein
MTDRTEEQAMGEFLECVDDARVAIAQTLDRLDVDVRVAIIALSTLQHQAQQGLDKEDKEIVESLASVCIEAVDEQAQQPQAERIVH